MDKLPEYVNNFRMIYSETLVELLITIENSFNALNYQDHSDDIASVFDDTKQYTGKDLDTIAISFYREHIDTVLSLQGIFLANPETDKLNNIVKLLHAVSILATVKLSEIYDGHALETESLGDVYFAKLIQIITEIPVAETLTMVKYLNPSLIDYLRKDIPVIYIMTDSIANAERRFKASPLLKVGVIVDAIRALPHFGYNVNTFIITHAETISNLTSLEDIANEIILLVLGSSVSDNLLESTTLSIVEHISDSADQTLKLNNIVLKYYRENNNG